MTKTITTKTCNRCARTGSRGFSVTSGKYTCDDYVACAKRQGYVATDIRDAINWLSAK